jgi:hypothetical protein
MALLGLAYASDKKS